MTGVGEADGRVRRGRRNKEAVVSALLSLIEDGHPQPGARDIAARAGLSLRSIFAHFEDVESLYCEAGARTMATIGPMLAPVDQSLPLPVRVAQLVARRAEALEAVTPVASAARLREPFSAQLRANRDQARALFRAQLERTFQPELARLAARRRCTVLDALLVAGSFASWYTLREEQGLCVEDAAAVVRATVEGLLGAVPPSVAAAEGVCR